MCLGEKDALGTIADIHKYIDYMYSKSKISETETLLPAFPGR